MISTTFSLLRATVQDYLTDRQVTYGKIKETAVVKKYFITQAGQEDMAALEEKETKMLQVKKDSRYLREAGYAS